MPRDERGRWVRLPRTPANTCHAAGALPATVFQAVGSALQGHGGDHPITASSEWRENGAKMSARWRCRRRYRWVTPTATRNTRIPSVTNTSALVNIRALLGTRALVLARNRPIAGVSTSAFAAPAFQVYARLLPVSLFVLCPMTVTSPIQNRAGTSHPNYSGIFGDLSPCGPVLCSLRVSWRAGPQACETVATAPEVCYPKPGDPTG